MTLVDNRTQLQDCEAAADVSGDTTAAPTSTSSVTGTVIQGTNSIGFQMDDAQEVVLFDQDSASATFNVDMSDMTVYAVIKYNLGELFANVGGLIAFGDGADGAGGDIVGYACTGADVAGFPYELRFGVMKLDVSVVVASPGTAGTDHYVYAGTEAGLNHAAVLQVGYGSFGLVKAVSTAVNAWFDGFYYIANDSYALTIQGGTSGTPETMVDVAADDVTSGLAMINNPKGSEYGFFAPTEWGTPSGTADSYFTATDNQWFWIGDNQGGHAVAATHFPFRFIGNSTGTNSVVLTRVVIVCTSTRAEFDVSNADMDFVQFDSCTLVDLGAITCAAANDVDKFFLDTIFSNCAQVDPGATNFDDCTFNGTTDATGALLMDETHHNQQYLTGMTFNSDGTGHGIQLAPTGAGPFTFNFDNFQNSGYGADDTANAFVDINPATSTANITINLLNGAGTITTDETGYTGTLTIIDAKTVEVTGLTEGAAAKVIANETVGTLTVGDVIMEVLANASGVASIADFNYEAAFGAGVDVIVRCRQQGLCNFAISEDNAVFVDETTESNSSTTNDMNLIVDTAPVAGQDWFYFGHAEQFNRLKLDIGTAMAGGALLDFEYWNGAWTNLSGVVDGTSDYSNTGENTISWTLPGDWATTSVDSKGPVFYIRIGYLSGTVSTAPRGRKCKLDVTRYIPFVQDNEITDSGMSTVAAWTEDTISKFDDAD